MNFPVRFFLLSLILLASGFGCTSRSLDTSTSESTTTFYPASFDPTILIGRWHTEFGDGGIGGYRDYTFYSDGSFAVEGYPAWNEYGTYEVTGYDNNLVTISFMGTTGEQASAYQAVLQFEPNGTEFNSPTLGNYTRAE